MKNTNKKTKNPARASSKLNIIANKSMDSVLKLARDILMMDPSVDPDEAMTKALMMIAKKKSKSLELRRLKDMEMSRDNLRKLVQVRYDYQDLRIRTSNRLSKKADGSNQNKDDAILPEDKIPQIRSLLDTSKDMEDEIEAAIKSEVEKFPIYTEFLSKVKGCGPSLSAILISSIDINKAVYASKMVQYAGLNPGMQKGKRKDADGNIIETDELVRGDRPTKGYLLPYNAFLKTKLMGVLAGCMLKANSQYKIYYDNMKERLSNSDKSVNGKTDRKWKDESKSHINMAAQRYMIKMFLQDLYGVWRELEGLPVRRPYQEEYLGHVSSMLSIAKQIMEDKI